MTDKDKSMTQAERLRHSLEHYKGKCRQLETDRDLAVRSMTDWHKATDATLLELVLAHGEDDPETGGKVLRIDKPDVDRLKKYTVHTVADGEKYVISAAPVRGKKA